MAKQTKKQTTPNKKQIDVIAEATAHLKIIQRSAKEFSKIVEQISDEKIEGLQIGAMVLGIISPAGGIGVECQVGDTIYIDGVLAKLNRRRGAISPLEALFGCGR